MSLSHRVRVIRARGEGVPAFDVLCLMQTNVYLGVLQSGLKSMAIMSAQMVDKLRDTSRPPVAMARCCAAGQASLPVLPV